MTDEPDPDRDVLKSLPRTRPVRRSAKRAGSGQGATAPAGAKAKAQAAPKRKAPAKKPKATTGAKAAPPPQRKVPPAGYAAADPDTPRDAPGPHPGEIVTTAVQAGVELTQIGLTVSRQALKSVLSRLPKP